MSDSNDVHANNRGVAIGGNANNNTIVTGDGITINNTEITILANPTDAQSQQVLASLVRAYASPRIDECANTVDRQLLVNAPGVPPIRLSESAAQGLLHAAQHAGENEYLAALRANPRYGRWAAQFVPLAGLVTEVKPGAEDIQPQFALLERQGEGPARQITRTRLADITQATAQYDALVIHGKPGCGKTTTLYRLAFDEASKQLTTGAGRVPLLIPLADYRGYVSPFEFVSAVWRERRGNVDFDAALQHGRLLLLIDALNEMPIRDDTEYRGKVEAWRHFVGEHPGNQFVFTCRSHDYSEKLGLHEVEIEDLDNPRVQDFLIKYLPAERAARAWAKLESSPLLDLVRNPFYLWLLASLLEHRDELPANRAALFDGFIGNVLTRERKRNHPDWLGDEPLQDALSALAESLQPNEGTRLPKREFLTRIPAQVTGTYGTMQTPAETVYNLSIAANVLDTEKPAEEEHARFYHHQLQEYFAARALLKRWRAGEDVTPRWKMPRLKTEMPDPGKLGDFEPLPPPPTTRWEEPTILAAGLCQDPTTFLAAVRAVNPVLAARCLTESGITAPPEVTTQAQDTLLREMGDLRVHLRYRIAAGDALGNLGDPRLQEIGAGGARVLVPPFVDIPAGKFTMGSSRWEVWQLKTRGSPADDELPRHPVDVPAFHIAQYPVTNAEYACFIHAGGYADEKYWHTEAARKWLRGEGKSGALKQYMQVWQAIQDPKQLAVAKRMATSAQAQAFEQLAKMSEEEVRALFSKALVERRRDQPAFWDDATANNPSQPAVGVTWFEANAYCAWLTGKLKGKSQKLKVRRGGQLLTLDFSLDTWSIRLPTEAEWEKAARETRGWKYPWGNQWDAERANTDESHTVRATPVGIYPNGATPEQIFDLAGNVWEWTSTLYRKYPYRNDDREDPEGEDARVVRGGSSDDRRGDARCAFRDWGVPGVYLRYLGLRLVLSPISDSVL